MAKLHENRSQARYKLMIGHNHQGYIPVRADNEIKPNCPDIIVKEWGKKKKKHMLSDRHISLF